MVAILKEKNRSKRYVSDYKSFDKTKSYSVVDAVAVLQKFTPTKKYAPTVEIHVALSIDPQKTEQNIRGSISLPHGVGKQKKVLVFADGEEAEIAKKNGADYVGMDDLVEKIQKQNWTDFDVAIAIPRSMKNISKLGKFLGPRGLMPSPKNGTLTEDIAFAVSEFKKGRLEFKNDKNGSIHSPVGKFDFESNKLVENINAFLDYLKSIRPQSVKGNLVKKVYICHTVSPSIELNIEVF